MSVFSGKQSEDKELLVASKSSTPRYRLLKQWIEEKVACGDWEIGKRIPPEHKLMAVHNISRGTVRRAMDELEFEGRVDRCPGRGTFIAEPGLIQKAQWAVVLRYRHGECSEIQGIESFAVDNDANVIAEFVDDSQQRLEAASKRLIEAKVKGILVEAPPYEDTSTKIYQQILDAGVSLVLLRTLVPGVDAPLVAFNYERIGREITQHLLDLGHRRIGYVSSPKYWGIEQILVGYRAALTSINIEPREDWVSLEQIYSPERGFKAATKLLELPEPPTAIITLNAETAANVYQAIAAAGLRIPQDISVAAASSLGPHLPAAMSPALTVWCPADVSYRLGRLATRVLHGLIENTWPEDMKEAFVDPAPVPRGSVALAPEENTK